MDAIELLESALQKFSPEEKLHECLEPYYKLWNQVLFLLDKRESFCFISGKLPSFSLIGFRLFSKVSPSIALHILLEPLNLDYLKNIAKVTPIGSVTLHDILLQICGEKKHLLSELYNWLHFVTGAIPRMFYVVYNEFYKNRELGFESEEEIHIFFENKVYNAILLYCPEMQKYRELSDWQQEYYFKYFTIRMLGLPLNANNNIEITKGNSKAPCKIPAFHFIFKHLQFSFGS